MLNPRVNVLLRVEQIISSISYAVFCLKKKKSAGSLAGIRPWIPVRFRFDHRAHQCRVHAMPVRGFSNELFGAVTPDVHGGTVASRKRRLGGQVDVGARFRGMELGCQRRFRVYKKWPSRIVNDLGNLAAGASRENSRAKDQRR